MVVPSLKTNALGIPSTLVDGIIQVSGVPAHAYWERERRGLLLVGFLGGLKFLFTFEIN